MTKMCPLTEAEANSIVAMSQMWPEMQRAPQIVAMMREWPYNGVEVNITVAMPMKQTKFMWSKKINTSPIRLYNTHKQLKRKIK